MGAGALAPGIVYAVFPKDKEYRAFEMLEKIEFSLKPGRYETTGLKPSRVHVHWIHPLPVQLGRGASPSI